MKQIFLKLIPFHPANLAMLLYGFALWFMLCWLATAGVGFVYWIIVFNLPHKAQFLGQILLATLYGIAWLGGWIYMAANYIKLRIKPWRKDTTYGIVR